ncbi:hypothetical protein Tco_0240058 [Tanacetum coccineum]
MPGPISSGLVPNTTPAALYVPPTTQDPINQSSLLISISLDQDAPLGSHSPSSSGHQSSLVHQGVIADHSFEANPFAPADHEPFVNVFASDPSSPKVDRLSPD